jgi:hypothetical protein
MVYAYDITMRAFRSLYPVLKKTPTAPAKAFDMVVRSFGIMKPDEIKKIEGKISGYEKRIKGLYYEIGKTGAKTEDIESPLAAEPVKKLISDVREYEKEIKRLENRIHEIRDVKKEEARRRKEKKAVAKVAAEKPKITEEQVIKTVLSCIEKSVKQAVFESSSERAIFDKVATDLLDSEMEIKIMAAAELGKIGNEAAMPILIAAVGFDNLDLTSEIINSLTSIGALGAISLFKEKISDSQYRIRIGCLRGLHKLADDEDAIPLLTEALKDPHPEVRRTAATFLGWKDITDAVPALMQCLRDEEVKVRKAAVSALANIKDEASVPALIKVLGDKNLEIREKALESVCIISGEEIEFDVHTSGKALKKAVEELRGWWENRMLGELDVTGAAEPDEEMEAFTAAAQEIEGPKAVTPEAEEEFEAEAEEREPEAEEIEPDVKAAETPKYIKKHLMRMVKADLLSICKDLGIECDETLTKAEITKLILEGTE